MGRIFLGHIGGTRLFSCASCDTILTNRSELISTRFTGATGRAFLFNKAVNLNYSETQDRVMLTGRHIVRDVTCKNCESKVGWMYEFATEENQRYKEGKVILERALITESEGFDETPAPVTVRATQPISSSTNPRYNASSNPSEHNTDTTIQRNTVPVETTESNGASLLSSSSSSSNRHRINVNTGNLQQQTQHTSSSSDHSSRRSTTLVAPSIGSSTSRTANRHRTTTTTNTNPPSSGRTADETAVMEMVSERRRPIVAREDEIDRLSASMAETVARFPRMLHDLSGALGASFFPNQQSAVAAAAIASERINPTPISSTSSISNPTSNLTTSTNRNIFLNPQVSALFRPSPLLTTLGRTGILVPREIFNYYGITPFYDDFEEDAGSTTTTTTSAISIAEPRRTGGVGGVGSNLGAALGSLVRRNIPLPSILTSTGHTTTSLSSTIVPHSHTHPPRRCNPINQQNRYAQTSPSQTPSIPHQQSFTTESTIEYRRTNPTTSSTFTSTSSLSLENTSFNRSIGGAGDVTSIRDTIVGTHLASISTNTAPIYDFPNTDISVATATTLISTTTTTTSSSSDSSAQYSSSDLSFDRSIDYTDDTSNPVPDATNTTTTPEVGQEINLFFTETAGTPGTAFIEPNLHSSEFSLLDGHNSNTVVHGAHQTATNGTSTNVSRTNGFSGQTAPSINLSNVANRNHDGASNSSPHPSALHGHHAMRPHVHYQRGHYHHHQLQQQSPSIVRSQLTHHPSQYPHSHHRHGGRSSSPYNIQRHIHRHPYYHHNHPHHHPHHHHHHSHQSRADNGWIDSSCPKSRRIMTPITTTTILADANQLEGEQNYSDSTVSSVSFSQCFNHLLVSSDSIDSNFDNVTECPATAGIVVVPPADLTNENSCVVASEEESMNISVDDDLIDLGDGNGCMSNN